MATSVQKNLVDQNQKYQSGFTQGHLPLPPAKKYAVGKSRLALLGEYFQSSVLEVLKVDV